MKVKEQYFDRVYDDTYTDILKYVVAKTSRADEVEDIVQAVYQKFYMRICRRGHSDINNPQAFLISSARREIIRFYATKRLRNERETTFEPSMEAEVPFESTLEHSDAAQAVWETVKELAPESYRVFTLYYGFDLPVEEVAKTLGLTPQAVKSRLFRARNEVRSRLKGESYD